MTLVSQIITDAFRETNLVAAGASETSTLQTEALRLLNRIIAGVMGWEVGESLAQWPVGTAGYASQDVPPEAIAAVWAYPTPNVMLACNLAAAQTIYLPVQSSDGARIGVQDLRANFNTYNLTLDGNGRQIEGAATLVLSTASLNRSWFFRADLGNWTRFTTLIAGDTFPFPTEFEDWFVMMLALRLSPRMGPALPLETKAAMKRANNAFIARYVQSEDLKINTDLSSAFMSRQSYATGGGATVAEYF